MTRRRLGGLLGAGVVLVLLAAAVGGGGFADASPTSSAGTRSGTDVTSGTARRILVISVPTLTYGLLDARIAPHLSALVDDATIADLTVRGVQRDPSFIAGYVTLGAGTRAKGGGPLDGRAFNTGEVVGGVPASELYHQRTGREPGAGIVHLGIGEIIHANESQPYDADVGALGTELAAHGWGRAVIANADTVDLTSGTPIYHREAVAALMDHDGHVPAGDVSADLLQQDPAAPFGQRLDPAAVDRRFAAVWKDHRVVLVEGSDLVRAAAARDATTPDQQPRARADALGWTDDLVGRLLARVDPKQDAVVLVAPAHDPDRVTTTVAGVRARFDDGWPPGLAASGTTRRAGFVQLVDVAPTVLQLAGIERPASMEGRTFAFAETGGTAADRREFLAAADAESQFRDEMLVPVYTTFLVLLLITFVAVAVVVARPSTPGVRVIAWIAAYSILVFFPSVLAASVFDFSGPGWIAYWAFIAGVAAVLIALAALVAWLRSPFDALLAALALLVLVIGIDVVTGSHLEWISTLGYSPTGAGRFTGMGNLCYSAFSAGGLMLGVLIVDRFGRRALPVTVALYCALIVVNGLPMWGSDIGGVLSMVPALAVTGWLLGGGRVRVRTLAVASGIALVVVGLLTGLDLLRPPGARTHLGRLAETARTEGWAGVWTVISRKAELNIDTWGTSLLRIAIPLVVLFVGWVWWRHRARLDALAADHPPLLPGVVGLAILVVLGFALNDSGIAIPGVMAGLAGAVLGVLLLDPAPVGPHVDTASDRGPPPAGGGDPRGGPRDTPDPGSRPDGPRVGAGMGA